MSYVLGKDLKLQSQLREIQLQLEELEQDVAENIESDTTSMIDSMCSSVSFVILVPYGICNLALCKTFTDCE